MSNAPAPEAIHELAARYNRRRDRVVRWLRPPLPLVHNPSERFLPETTPPRLFVGGAAGRVPAGFLCVDLLPWPGVHVATDAHALAFVDNSVGAIECDAVLEHVQDPDRVVMEFERVLRPGGYLHVVVPFIHPYHAYPEDFRRWTEDGLKRTLSRFEIVASGVRTGPAATLLIVVLEFLRMLAPRPLRGATYVAAGWLLWPLRYLDPWLLHKPEAHVLANSIYILARKRHSDSGDRGGTLR